jgi:serine/threonine protein kinase/tetratricopeptide (TPR) repeat protein
MPDAVTSSNSGRPVQTRQRIGKYQIFGRLGRGGMGSVHRAYDPALERLVALKVISASTELTDELRARFFLEAQACARLTHPNIVTIYDLGEADGQLFIVMELLDGEELRQLIARRGPLSVRDKLSLMIQLCDGLEYAHGRGILHRDVKPGNIFVQRDGRVKILDFGVARIEAADTPVTRTGLLVGTLQYMAPERVRGHGDARSDIFAVGAVLYELLTYRAAFGGADPMEILEKLRIADPEPASHVDALVPPELDAVVSKAIDRDPERRFQSLGEMGVELRAVQQRLAAAPESGTLPLDGESADRVRSLREALLTRIGTLDRITLQGQRASAGLDSRSEVARLQNLLARAERLQPVLDDGLAALARNDHETAIAILGWVAREMPEHARAADSLSEARRRAAGERVESPAPVDEPRAVVASPPTTASGSSASRPATIEPTPSGAMAQERDEDSTLLAEVASLAPPRPGPARPSRVVSFRKTVAARLSATSRAAAGWNARVRRLRLEHPSAQQRLLIGVGAVVLVGILAGILGTRLTQRPTDSSGDLERLVAAARERAIRAEAPALAAASFSTAESATAEAERLVRRGSRGDAVAALRTATDRYETAAREAGQKREHRAAADRDRQRMQEAKQRAPENGTELPAAREHEQHGNALYAKLEFESAARSFGQAAELYAKAVAPPADSKPVTAAVTEAPAPRPAAESREPAPPPPPTTPDPRAQIRSRLGEYVKAIETKNLALLRQIRPNLGEAELRRWARFFDMTRSRKVGLTVQDIAVDGEKAQVTGRRVDVTVLDDGQRIEDETRFVYTLEHRRDGWVILGLRETKDASPNGSR